MEGTRSKVIRTKIGLFILLAVLTAIFAGISFIFFEKELEFRIHPQIERAIVQVSRILPQLKENEEALREVSSQLEKSRKQIVRASEGLSEDSENGEEDDVETVISETLSWMNRVTKLRVGRGGHVIVVSKDDYSILAHSDERFVGEKLHLVGGKLNLEDIPKLEESDGKIKKKDLLDDFYLFLPDSFFQKDPESERYIAAVDAGIYGSIFSYEDTFILCGATIWETWMFVVIRCFFTTLFFFAIAWIFVRFIGFALLWRKEEPKAFRGKLVSYAVLSVVVSFCVIWYYQTMMDMTGDIATMNDHAQVAVETLNTYRQYRNKLSTWLNEQYLEQCRLAADLILEKGKDNFARKDMEKLAKDLGVDYVYIFDKNGKVLVTNSPYDHFELSKNKEDQSYAFRVLLDGKESVVQEAQIDDMGDKKQYVGVSIRDEDDLCDGFVQIAINPHLQERLLNPINVQTVLDNLVIGLPEYALAIDKETLKIVATTGLGYRKASVEDLGINVEQLVDGFDGIFIINDKTYYAGVSESEDLYLMPLVRSTDNANALVIACKLALFAVVSYFLMVCLALSGYGSVWVKEADDEESEEEGSSFNTRQVEEMTDFEIRWRKQSAIPDEEKTPEMRVGRIVYQMLLVFSTLLILFETSLIYAGMTRGVSLDGFSYVLMGKWEKGLNLFSFTFCLFLVCVLYVFQELLNQILYRIAKVSNPQRETILLLLRNALKYACALIFLYIGLAKFGVDTKALWASAGVISLMVGFGAKDLIGDVIAGLFIIFEGTYKIDDFITVGSWYGTVQEIGLRYTKVGYYSETKIFNNSAMRDVVNCDGDVAREVLRMPLPYETDLLEVEKMLERELPIIGKNIPGLIKPPEYQGVNSFEDSCIMLRIVIYCNAYSRRKALRSLNREMKLLYDRMKINIPYNHVVVSDYKDEVHTYVDVPEAAEGAGEGQS